MIARLSTALLCLALAGLAASQTPRGQGPVTQPGQRQARIPPSFYSDTVDYRTHADMQGMWRIERMEWNDEVWAGRDIAGFAFIGEGQLALELHVRIFVNTAEEMLLQTGIYRYDFNAMGEMQTHCLIGSNNLVDPLELSATRPGEITRFRVRLAGDVLILQRPGSSLTMRRTQQPPPPFFDPERARLRDRVATVMESLEVEQLDALVDQLEEGARRAQAEEEEAGGE